jgi:glycerophosphoryl diester phosphodiesterase
VRQGRYIAAALYRPVRPITAPLALSAPLVIAHRGASGYEVENSLAAFRRAVELGADGVELDVHASADGTLFVHHDGVIPPHHVIPELPSAEVRRLALPNGEPIPTLEEALVAAGRLRVFIEVKALDSCYDERLFQAIDRGPNPAGYAVHSFDHRIIRRLGALRPALPRGVLSSSYLVHPLAPLEDTGAGALWQERGLIDRALVLAVHAINRRLIAWTVDRPEEMERLLSAGVDGLCTNLPDMGRRVVGARAA